MALLPILVPLWIAFVPALSNIASATETPRELEGIGITEHLGATVSIHNLHFTDEQGKSVAIADLMRPGHPAILNLVYYECPNLCTFVLNGMVESLKQLDWSIGDQFDVVTVSINPRETPGLAAQKRQAYLGMYDGDANSPKARLAAKRWHFLTGTQDQISKLAGEVGFSYRYDEREKQYAHAAALYVLTPEGRISRYLYGIDFRPRDMKLALNEASGGKIGTVIERILLFCYHYDPQTRKYSMVATRVMEAGSAGTTLLVGGYLVFFWSGQRRQKKKKSKPGASSEPPDTT